jgi:hypothetical protein
MPPGEACALAAATITEEQLGLLDRLVGDMTRAMAAEDFEKHELEFHLAVARATGNAAITATVEDLWTLRRQSTSCAAAWRRARSNTRGDFVGEHRRIAAALRTRDPKAALQAMHAHLVSTIRSDKPGTLTVGIGITRRKGPNGSGVFTKDLGPGWVSYWEPTDPVKGTMGIALMVDPKSLLEVRQDAENYLVLVRVEPGNAFVYYMGTVWDKDLDFHDRASWEGYVRGQKPDFDPDKK